MKKIKEKNRKFPTNKTQTDSNSQTKINYNAFAYKKFYEVN